MNFQDIASASALLRQELMPLADKLGKAGGWTYELFLKQVYVNAIMNLFWIAVGVIALYLMKECKKLGERDVFDSEITTLLSFGLFVVGIMLILVPLADLVQVLLNPNYQAITLILETIKNK